MVIYIFKFGYHVIISDHFMPTTDNNNARTPELAVKYQQSNPTSSKLGAGFLYP